MMTNKLANRSGGIPFMIGEICFGLLRGLVKSSFKDHCIILKTVFFAPFKNVLLQKQQSNKKNDFNCIYLKWNKSFTLLDFGRSRKSLNSQKNNILFKTSFAGKKVILSPRKYHLDYKWNKL